MKINSKYIWFRH